MLTDQIPYTEEMIRSYLNRKETIIRLAFDTFKRLGMIEVVNEQYLLVSNWSKHQNIAGMEKIKLQNKERQARYREKRKDLLLDTKEKDKDKDKELDIDTHNVINNVTSNVTTSHIKGKPNFVYADAVNYLNDKAGTNYKHTSSKTRTLIDARVKDGFKLKDFQKVIDNKTKEWLKTDMAKYLRPETLFGTKFESYLNQPVKETSSGIDWFDEYVKGKENA
jgi:uncharacterized phage protein (TIGR02220 family)